VIPDSGLKNIEKMHSLSLFFLSASLLALEISLMRILRVEGFGNFTSTAIALAMTGFGAGGTAVFILKNRINGREHVLSFHAAVFLVFFLGLGSWISMQVPFDALRILWDRNQLLRLLLRFFIYTIPFISGSAFIVLAFLLQRAGKAYFYNLTGSGFGVVAILASLYLLPPDRILLIPLILASLGALILGVSIRPGRAGVILAVLLLPAGFLIYSQSSIRMLPYKGLKLALNFPDARIIERDLSPYGTLEVVESDMIRNAPGLSLSYEGELPPQLGLFLDGDSLSAISVPGEKGSIEHLHYQTQAAVYTLHQHPDVFLIGLGGGNAVLRAFFHGARSITAAEENPRLVDLISEKSQILTGGTAVQVFAQSARGVLSATGREYDIIEFSETDSTVSSIGGIYSSDLNYTLTIQAFTEYLHCLKEMGTFSATVLLRYPPRSLLRLMNLSKEALEALSADPDRCMIVIRSWASGTVLLKAAPFTAQEIETVKGFCKDMRFDLVYYPGIEVGEANRYNILKEEHYYEGAMRILGSVNDFVKRYPFNIGVSTDEKPYFSFFFRIAKFPYLLRLMGGRWILVVEGGELVLFSTFILTILLSFILIIIPQLLTGSRLHGRILIYFSLIAIAFMAVEIVLIGKFLRFLESPLYAGSAIIASLLIFSGIGSLLMDKFFRNQRSTALVALSFLACYLPLLLLTLNALGRSIISLPLGIKLTISLLLIAPAGIAMGIPFPSAIQGLRSERKSTIPWAWSVNSYFSVIASTGAVLASAGTGLFLTGLAAALCYLLAAAFFPE